MRNARSVQKSFACREAAGRIGLKEPIKGTQGTGRCSVRMDRRLNNRALADLDARVTRLTKPAQTIGGRIEDVSDHGVCVILPNDLHPGEMVKLEAADSTLFGYVVHSSWKRNAFRIGIEVERVLVGGTDLAQLLRSVLERSMPGVTLSQ